MRIPAIVIDPTTTGMDARAQAMKWGGYLYRASSTKGGINERWRTEP